MAGLVRPSSKTQAIWLQVSKRITAPSYFARRFPHSGSSGAMGLLFVTICHVGGNSASHCDACLRALDERPLTWRYAVTKGPVNHGQTVP